VAAAPLELALTGPPEAATVIAATGQATYLQLADEARTMICLAATEAVRVPCALVIGSRALPPQVRVGTPARVGEGQLTVRTDVFRVVRWWRPPRPQGLGAVAPSRLAAAVRWLAGQVADPLDPEGRAAVAELVESLATGGRPEEPVARLLGRGPGLTPTGDDVLAGTLVTLLALGSPTAIPLARAIAALAPGATTSVSAGLLRHAADGRCIPQLDDVLTAIAGAGTAAGPLPRAAGALLAVGHTSGAGLLHGVLVAVAIAHARLANDVVRLAHRPAPVAA
jgi:hypothetical protein